MHMRYKQLKPVRRIQQRSFSSGAGSLNVYRVLLKSCRDEGNEESGMGMGNVRFIFMLFSFYYQMEDSEVGG